MDLLKWLGLTTLCFVFVVVMEHFFGDPEPENWFGAFVLIYMGSLCAYPMSKLQGDLQEHSRYRR